jgi:hypothetical protein
MSVSNTNPNTVSNTVANAYTAGPLKPSGDHIYLPMSSGVHEPENLSDIGVVNGDFVYWTADDPDGWTVSESAPNSEVTEAAGGDACRIVSTDGTYASITQAAILTIGKQYRIRIEITDWTAGSIIINNAGFNWALSSVGVHETTFTSAITYLEIKRNNVTDITFTNITITENLVTDGDMEAVGVADWNAGGGATLTKVAGSPGGSGSQVLQIDGVTNCFAYPVISALPAVGTKVRVSGWARGDGSSAPEVQNNSAVYIIWTGTSSTSWQYFDVVWTVISGTDLLLRCTDDSGHVQFDEVSVEEISARTLDVSGYGHHALLGDGSTVATFPTKLSGDGYYTDGTNDYFKIPDEASIRIGTSDFAIGAVFQRLSTGTLKGVASKGLLGVGEWVLQFDDLANEIAFRADSGNIILEWVAVHSWAASVFCVIATRRNGVATLYVNGQPVASQSGVGAVDINTATDISIAAASAGTTRWMKSNFYAFYQDLNGVDQYGAADLTRKLLQG